jgi:hypothetical protein
MFGVRVALEVSSDGSCLANLHSVFARLPNLHSISYVLGLVLA